MEEVVRVERGGEIVRLHTLHNHEIHKTGHAHLRNTD